MFGSSAQRVLPRKSFVSANIVHTSMQEREAMRIGLVAQTEFRDKSEVGRKTKELARLQFFTWRETNVDECETGS